MAIENRLAFINVCSQSFKVTPESRFTQLRLRKRHFVGKKVNLLAVVKNYQEKWSKLGICISDGNLAPYDARRQTRLRGGNRNAKHKRSLRVVQVDEYENTKSNLKPVGQSHGAKESAGTQN